MHTIKLLASGWAVGRIETVGGTMPEFVTIARGLKLPVAVAFCSALNGGDAGGLDYETIGERAKRWRELNLEKA